MSEGPIFIGGTGRCGTSILRQILGRHPEIFAEPRESRFLIDHDGLITLVDALSTKWDPPTSDKALRRFEKMMLSLRKRSCSYMFIQGET